MPLVQSPQVRDIVIEEIIELTSLEESQKVHSYKPFDKEV